LTLSDVEERSVTDPCPWFWILSVEMGMLKCYDWYAVFLSFISI